MPETIPVQLNANTAIKIYQKLPLLRAPRVATGQGESLLVLAPVVARLTDS